MTVTINLIIHMPLDPVIPILGVYSKGILTSVQMIFTAALPVIVKNGKQPKCQSIRE